MPDTRSTMLAQMLAAKAAERQGQIMDPMTRYALGLGDAGEKRPSERAQKQAAPKKRRMRETDESAIMQRLMDAMVYSPSPAVEGGPGFVPAARLGLDGSYDRERGGYLHGLDTSRLSPADLAWLQSYAAQQQQETTRGKKGG